MSMFHIHQCTCTCSLFACLSVSEQEGPNSVNFSMHYYMYKHNNIFFNQRTMIVKTLMIVMVAMVAMMRLVYALHTLSYAMQLACKCIF